MRAMRADNFSGYEGLTLGDLSKPEQMPLIDGKM